MSFFLKSKNFLLTALFLAAIAGGIFGYKINNVNAQDTVKINNPGFEPFPVNSPAANPSPTIPQNSNAPGTVQINNYSKTNTNPPPIDPGATAVLTLPQARQNVDTAQKNLDTVKTQLSQNGPLDPNDPALLKAQQDLTTAQKQEVAVQQLEDKKNNTIGKNPSTDKGFYLPVVFHIVGGILYLIVWLLNKLISVAANLAGIILNIKDFAKVGVVQSGWEITRGLANMFFALILLIMAFATTLRLESFGYKKILPRLVLAALLINFSLVFAGMIIDFANVFTTYFIDAITKNGGISAQLMNGLGINKIFDFSSNTGLTVNGTDSWLDMLKNAALGPSSNVIMELVAAAILFIIVAFSFLALSLFLIFRIVVIWLLLIFAPLAWVSMIVPGKAGSLWGQWWGIFLKWVFFAPIYCFFLFLGLLMVTQSTINNELVKSGTGAVSGTVFGSGFFKDPRILLQYVAVVIILLGGLIAAQKMGIYGASGVMKLGKGLTDFGKNAGQRWLAKGARIPYTDYLSKKLGPQKWAEKGWISQGTLKTIQAPGAVKRWIAPKLTPQVWSKSLAAIKARADQNAFEVASGNIEDTWESIKKLGGLGVKKTISDTRNEPEKQQELDRLAQEVKQKRVNNEPGYEWAKTDGLLKQNNIAPNTPEADAFMAQWDKQEAEKLYQPISKTTRTGPLAALSKIFNPDEYFARMKQQSIISSRQSEAAKVLRDEDQIVQSYLIAKDPAEKEALLRLVSSINGMNTLFGRMGKAYTPDAVREYIKKEFGEDAGARVGADISAIASVNGNFSLVGMTTWDAKENKTVFNTPEGQREIARVKAFEMEAQEFTRRIHPDSFFRRDESGHLTKELHDFGKYLVANLTGGQIKQVDRLQGRTLKALYDALGNIRDLAKSDKIVFSDGKSVDIKDRQETINNFADAIKTRYESPK